jgi:chromosome segregation ATPase
MARKSREEMLSGLRESHLLDLRQSLESIGSQIRRIQRHLKDFPISSVAVEQGSLTEPSLKDLKDRRAQLDIEQRSRSKQLEIYQSEMQRIEKQRKALQERLRQSEAKLQDHNLYLAAIAQHARHIEDAGILRRRKLECFYDGSKLPNTKEELAALTSTYETHITAIDAQLTKLRRDMETADSLKANLGDSPESFTGSVELLRISEVIDSIEIPRRLVRESLVATLNRQMEELEQAIQQIVDGEADELLWEDHQKALQAKRDAREKAKLEAERREKRRAQDVIRDRRQAEKYVREHAKAPEELARLIARNEKTKARLKNLKTRKEHVLSDLSFRYRNRISFERLTKNSWRWVKDPGRDSHLSGTWTGNYQPSVTDLIDDLSDYFPSLRNVKFQIEEVEKLLREESLKVEQARRIVKKLNSAQMNLSKSIPTNKGAGGRPKRVVTEWRHAEELARDFMVFLGFRDASLTGLGADGGIDVMSSKAVGQVKMHNKGVPRYDIQRLVGEASVTRKIPIFFAMSYSRDAISWSEEHGIALFKFERSGDVSAMTSKASDLESRQ